MIETTSTEANSLPFVCARHPEIVLQAVLRGGAGYCLQCRAFIQSANHPMPTLPPRPPAVAKPKRKRTAKATAKKTRQRKASATAKV